MAKKSLPKWCCGNRKIPVDTAGLHMLQYLIKEYKLKTIAEIGVFTGNLTGRVINSCKSIIEKYYCIDPWEPYPKHYDREPRPEELTAEYWDKIYRRVVGISNNHSEVEIIRKTSVDAAADVPDSSLDLVYIDAIHDYPNGIADIGAWIDKVKDGGFVTGHDYHARFQGMIRAVDEFFGMDIEILQDSNWFVRMISDKRKLYKPA
jgi:predicted O-methyltransferase YrrM